MAAQLEIGKAMHTTQTIQLISELQARAAVLYIILLAPSQLDAVRVPIKRTIIISNKIYIILYIMILQTADPFGAYNILSLADYAYIYKYYIIYPYGIRNRVDIINRMDNANIQCVHSND